MGAFSPGVESGPGEGRVRTWEGREAVIGVNGKVNERGKDGKRESHMTHFFYRVMYVESNMQILASGLGDVNRWVRVSLP